MIPGYQAFMGPFLEIANQANGKEVKLRDVIQQLVEQFELSEADRAEKLPSGKQSVLDNRVGWAKTYLVKAGLLEATRRSHVVITPRGIAALQQTDSKIDNQYLNQFAEFAEFKQSSSGTESVTPDTKANKESTVLSNSLDESTPDETLRSAFKSINNALAQDILARTRKVSPAFFEQLLIELLLAMGYGGSGEGAAHALGKSGDNGIDGVIDQDPLGVDQIYIQAKRYNEGKNIGAGDIRDFFGALNLKRAQKGIFITTSDFTASAIETAQNLGGRIVLINGRELAGLMLRYNVGCRTEQVLHLKKIDEEFFEEQ